MDVSVKELTVFRTSDDGKSVVLEMVSEDGQRSAVSFGIPELGNLVMTLPSLIETALRRQFRDTSLRYACPMGSWSIEQATYPAHVIGTLRTKDGFGVSFSMARSEAEEFGSSMAHTPAAPAVLLTH